MFIDFTTYNINFTYPVLCLIYRELIMTKKLIGLKLNFNDNYLDRIQISMD